MTAIVNLRTFFFVLFVMIHWFVKFNRSVGVTSIDVSFGWIFNLSVCQYCDGSDGCYWAQRSRARLI